MSRTSSPPIVPCEPREVATRIARRDFLRTCAVAGVALASGFHRNLTNSAAATGPGGKIVVGLEIGTSKVCAAVAERLADGSIKLLGIGHALSRGVDRYGILDFEAASQCVREALMDAEVKCDVMIRSVTLAVAGAKIAAYHAESLGEEICYADRGDGVLHRLPFGKCRHAPDCQIVAGAGPRIQNSVLCVNGLGVKVERLIFAPLASAEAVLTAEEKNLGALVIDMGEGTTDYAAYAGGALQQSDSWAVGGGHIANDLSLGLRLPRARAAKLAIEEGSVRLGYSLRSQRIMIGSQPGFTGRDVEREMLNTLIHHRVRGTFTIVKKRLEARGLRLDTLVAGMRLTGGCSLLPGICELAEEVFGIPAQRAHLEGSSTVASALKDPRLSCALGLAKFGGGIKA